MPSVDNKPAATDVVVLCGGDGDGVLVVGAVDILLAFIGIGQAGRQAVVRCPVLVISSSLPSSSS